MRKLEIGSGHRPLEGYEHLDINKDCPHLEYIAPMDKIPVEDNAFDEIQAIHVIEHQPWRTTLATLTEWVRVLKPGGMVRIATPNLRWIAQSYVNARADNPDEYLRDANVMLDIEREKLHLNDQLDVGMWANFKIMSSGIEYDQHYACYDAIILGTLLKEAGCSKIEVEHDGDSLVMRGWK